VWYPADPNFYVMFDSKRGVKGAHEGRGPLSFPENQPSYDCWETLLDRSAL
jgi:hypothetical protein